MWCYLRVLRQRLEQMAIGAVGWLKRSPTCLITPRTLVGLFIVRPVKDVPLLQRSCTGFMDLAKLLDRGALVVAKVSLERIWWFWGGSETATEAPPLILDIA